MVTFPRRLTTITSEANKIAPNRRKSSDGMLGDARHRAAGGDHNPDGAGKVHAVDISQSMPGTPYWEDRFQQFDVHAYQRHIAASYVSLSIATRAARWPWLADGGFMVGFDGVKDVIFNPSVSFAWRQNGFAKSDHANHGHFSIGHTVRSETDTQPIFSSTTEDDDDMPSIEEIRQVVKQELEKAIGGASMTPPDAHATVVDVVKQYTKK